MNTKERNEKLANEIKELLLVHGLDMDTRIYFNGKCFDSCSEGYKLIEDINPQDYMEYYNEETITMSFEGRLYDVINYGGDAKFIEEFEKLLDSYGFYYELGNTWNLALYQ